MHAWTYAFDYILRRLVDEFLPWLSDIVRSYWCTCALDVLLLGSVNMRFEYVPSSYAQLLNCDMRCIPATQFRVLALLQLRATTAKVQSPNFVVLPHYHVTSSAEVKPECEWPRTLQCRWSFQSKRVPFWHNLAMRSICFASCSKAPKCDSKQLWHSC